jgi:DNA-directed RNA polymerase subunit RPC12/RpoP
MLGPWKPTYRCTNCGKLFPRWEEKNKEKSEFPFCCKKCATNFKRRDVFYYGEPSFNECQFCGMRTKNIDKNYCSADCKNLDVKWNKFIVRENLKQYPLLNHKKAEDHLFSWFDDTLLKYELEQKLAESKTKHDKYKNIIFDKYLSCCNILKEHHNQLKEDPERLSTEFIKSLSNCNCNNK